MGRGRAKAKQAKVARRLKYDTGGTDLDALREELGVNSSSQDEYDADDSYEDLADRYADEEDEEDDERHDGGVAHR